MHSVRTRPPTAPAPGCAPARSRNRDTDEEVQQPAAARREVGRVGGGAVQDQAGARAPLDVLVDAGLSTHAWRVWEPLLTGGERVGPL